METFGEAMRDVFNDVTQQELAYALGLSRSIVCKYMGNVKKPGTETLAKIISFAKTDEDKKKLQKAYDVNGGKLERRHAAKNDTHIFCVTDNKGSLSVYKSFELAKKDGGEIHKAKWVNGRLTIGEIIWVDEY